MNNKKYIIIASILILIIVTYLFYYNTPTQKINRFFKKNGFKIEEGIYTKQLSELSEEEYYNNKENNIDAFNKEMFFNPDNYQIQTLSSDYYQGLTTIFTATYDFKEELLSYTHELNYSTKTYIFEGYLTEYNHLECNVINDSSNSITTHEKNTICSTINDLVLDCKNQEEELFKDNKIKNIIIEKSNKR